MYTEAIDCTLCTCTHDHVYMCVYTCMVALKFVIICLSVLGDIEQTLLLSLGSHFRFEFPLMFRVEMVAWRNKQGCIK